jgi:transcriptional regulator with XRE-family HTH domain
MIAQKTISRAASLSETCISHILSGKRSPRLSTARRLEAATGVPISVWRGGDPQAIRDALSGVRALPK